MTATESKFYFKWNKIFTNTTLFDVTHSRTVSRMNIAYSAYSGATNTKIHFVALYFQIKFQLTTGLLQIQFKFSNKIMSNLFMSIVLSCTAARPL